MLEVYSLDASVGATAVIPLNNVIIQKGCTAVNSAPATIQLNKCGVYCVSCNASSTDAITIEMYKNGVEQPQTQVTGTSVAFTTLVQVDKDNCDCPCSSPTMLQFFNIGDAATLDINVTVTKVV